MAFIAVEALTERQLEIVRPLLGKDPLLLAYFDEDFFSTATTGFLLTESGFLDHREAESVLVEYSDLVTFVAEPFGPARYELVLTGRNGSQLRRSIYADKDQIDTVLNVVRDRVGEHAQVGFESEIHSPEPTVALEPERILLSTTGTIEGRRIGRYLGLVAGDASVVGAPHQSGPAIARGRRTALRELESVATGLGAHAVVGIHIEYQVVGTIALIICATGTAVQLDDAAPYR